MRAWPAGLILILTALAVLYFRVFREDSQQWRNIYTMETGIVCFVLLLLWLLFLSRVRWRVRLLVFAGVAGFVAAAATLFEIRGVTGDLMPIFKFRWSRPSSLVASTVVASMEATSNSAPGQDVDLTHQFPQFLGPHRNSLLPEGPELARDWTSRPPEKLWRHPIGAGWSGFAIVGQRAVTLAQSGGDEVILCYELLTGKLLWSHSDPARYFTTIAGEGPRTTPAIAGEKVVTLGGTGILNCLDLSTGKVLWKKNIIDDARSRMPEWGVAGSPLIQDGMVIVNPGGTGGRSLVAYRLDNGDIVWSGGDDDASYSAPTAARLGDVSQILIFDQHAIFGHDAADGRVLWRHPWDSHQPHVALPIVVKSDCLLVSSGYGVGSELLRITRDASGNFNITRLWKTNRLKAKFNNPVTRDGYVYGLDDGVLACLDLSTGSLKWKDGRYGHGQFLLVRDLLLVTAENGEVALLDPEPDERRELSKFRALDGKTWNPPALAGNLLLVRNDQEAACYRLPVAR